MLYNENLSGLLIGCLLKQPQLLIQPQYPLCKEDFAPCLLHQIIYLCIQRLVRNGVQEVTEIEIENVAKNHPAQMEILQDNNYFDFIVTMKEFAIVDNYEYYYQTTRKFALLREMKAKGYDISVYYDEDGNEDQELSRLEKESIQYILNNVETDMSQLRSKYDVEFVRDEMKAGEDTDQLIEAFKEKPMFGAYLQSPYLSTLWQGWCRGHLLLRSAPSGVGKSRIAVGDLVNVCAMEMWDDEAKDFIGNNNYQGPGFFIHTEMNQRKEIAPMFLAAISGVEYKYIVKGLCDEEEERRVKKAGEILLQSNITLVDMPDFTNASIERKIKELVEREGCTYGVFDYVQIQSALADEYKRLTNMPVREDLVLKNSVLALKSMAERYNIGILSMTQLNDNWKTSPFPDESCLSGSKSMKVKLDGGSIVLSCKERPKELKEVESFLIKKGAKFGQKDNEPNIIEYIYKSRFGEYGDQKIKIFSHFNRGTFRRKDFLCCDANNKFAPVPKSVPGE